MTYTQNLGNLFDHILEERPRLMELLTLYVALRPDPDVWKNVREEMPLLMASLRKISMPGPTSKLPLMYFEMASRELPLGLSRATIAAIIISSVVAMMKNCRSAQGSEWECAICDRLLFLWQTQIVTLNINHFVWNIQKCRLIPNPKKLTGGTSLLRI